MLTLTRYAVYRGEQPIGHLFQPLREVAEWLPLSEDTIDKRAVEIDGYPGRWLLLTCREPLVDMVSQHTPATFNRFNELTDVGGELVGSQDLYRLPLLPGYELVTEDEYVDAWNAVCAPDQRIGAVA